MNAEEEAQSFLVDKAKFGGMHGQEEPGRKCTPPDLLTQPPPDLYALYNEEETSHIPSPVVEWFTSYSSLGPSWSGGPAVL